jgi:hypothetical protein
MNENSKNMGGAFLIILFVVFATLKLTGMISWSWLWVTAPLWMPFAFWVGCLVLVILWAFFMIPLSWIL